MKDYEHEQYISHNELLDLCRDTFDKVESLTGFPFVKVIESFQNIYRIAREEDASIREIIEERINSMSQDLRYFICILANEQRLQMIENATEELVKQINSGNSNNSVRH